MKMNDDWWRDFVILVSRPIPPGYMVGMRDEIRGGKHFVVEFLEKVPGWGSPQEQPRGSSQEQSQESQHSSAPDSAYLCIDFERGGEVLFTWSAKHGFRFIENELEKERR